ncbi:unnamed protein product [Adineta ricciae]|uniref:Uncharacterized protein n=1 Tax=Adineta ricciae TaxID=249248 RepID=A0A816EFM0_ADIRI|nr:unnamed protein product [Adineta ricciae]CAF1645358.1 unnamed protein product [Adineta ricciae]
MSNFHLSSREIIITDNILRAQCQKTDGTWNNSEVDLNTCLSNENGQIIWKLNGQFADSCSQIKNIDQSSILTCEVQRGDGQWVTTQIDLREHIGNNDGTLYVSLNNQNNSSTSLEDTCRMEALRVHNVLRARHGVPPLVLDDKMSKKAQDYAEFLANNGLLQHSSPEERDELGENIFAEFEARPENNLDLGRRVAQAWYDEIKNYDYSNPGFAMNTGHFTQVVWKDTNKLGIGVVFVPDRKIIVVGRYSPPGNVPDQFTENVLPLS